MGTGVRGTIARSSHSDLGWLLPHLNWLRIFYWGVWDYPSGPDRGSLPCLELERRALDPSKYSDNFMDDLPEPKEVPVLPVPAAVGGSPELEVAGAPGSGAGRVWLSLPKRSYPDWATTGPGWWACRSSTGCATTSIASQENFSCLCRNGKCKANGLSIVDGVMDWMEPSRPLESVAGPPIRVVDEEQYQEIRISITPRFRARARRMHIVSMVCHAGYTFHRRNTMELA